MAPEATRHEDLEMNGSAEVVISAPAERWEYRFERVDGGTRVVESFSWTWMPSNGGFRARVGTEPIGVRASVAQRREYLIDSMRTTSRT